MDTSTLTHVNAAGAWDTFWQGGVGQWLATKGLHIVLVLVFAVVTTRLIRWVAGRISRRLNQADSGDAMVRSETVKHRQAVASVISSVAIAVLYVVVGVDIANQLGLPVGSLVAPAAVLGAAIGFGAQRIVQDLLSGFFIITEKQYGFGDLVDLTVNGGGNARGTVEDVTLRVTKLRTGDGEMFTVPNGQIVKSLNLSKDWARAVVDIPVPKSEDINHVNEVLREVSAAAMRDGDLPDLLLDEPSLMGVESIEVDSVNLRMVARTLPGKQFEVGRRMRALVVAAFRRNGIATPGGQPPVLAGVGADGEGR
ncbi:mechanosensitive ion channel family protein [Mycolicibacterium litorale]|uniref:Mechanosensitive ion channel protein MscS n=1 Tax=Mycolicibacterium litorale TaxID=758802 RepID=A0AAD1IN41_9MYCO|nr:mechanosensitive ion channel family protein [Mycolicibacterium litorale]MCV7417255.1 mechanosensitive ion channel family protein [Mycolicibacterium litorale]TDY05043.1 small conductance mechanosensitive channel [Mycolicibacterium litorale]BBY18474.1 mechanosensitive ion channel protein MscS [Mycolicibacterium litorale]